MIVYNVSRSWFTEKVAAETYRKVQGLKPTATIKLTIDDRDGLAQLLNALCEPGAAKAETVPAEVIDQAYVEPERSVPDLVPLFLINDRDDRERVRADRLARGLLA